MTELENNSVRPIMFRVMRSGILTRIQHVQGSVMSFTHSIMSTEPVGLCICTHRKTMQAIHVVGLKFSTVRSAESEKQNDLHGAIGRPTPHEMESTLLYMYVCTCILKLMRAWQLADHMVKGFDCTHLCAILINLKGNIIFKSNQLINLA